ncbi:hypothetical protein AVEN_74461-1 [Araneus ventricosus]|uniref:Uncharacterized protein n=1 Tax=Araneus ventricosus TaxID=182803 RepID=A0A4Y2TVF8_ARAVE|nr:hypothetical protein AVEN_74461-1 [Araneus ventricosus]
MWTSGWDSWPSPLRLNSRSFCCQQISCISFSLQNYQAEQLYRSGHSLQIRSIHIQLILADQHLLVRLDFKTRQELEHSICPRKATEKEYHPGLHAEV